MIGLRELLVIAIVLVVVWYAMRYVGVRDARRRRARRDARDDARAAADDAVDTVFDPATGAYVPKEPDAASRDGPGDRAK